MQAKKLDIHVRLTGVAIFGYILLRAARLDITYDEARTLKEFVPETVMHIINYTPCDANNHIVNTLLIKLLFGLGNHSLFIARLPNVLASVVYLIYAYRLCKENLSPGVGYCCFLLLVLNPFVLDFFSIARGYGLCLAFELGSLYFTLQYLKSHHSRHWLLALICGTVAVLSNFSALVYWLALVLTVNVFAIFKKECNAKTIAIYTFGVAVTLASILYEPIRKMLENGSLYYGGKIGFYHDTLGSLAQYSLYNPGSTPLSYIVLNVFLLLLGVVVTFSFVRNRALYAPRSLVLTVTGLCILSVVVQHYLFGTRYLIDRTALFFYPLLILILCFSIGTFSGKSSMAIIISVVVAFSFNFFRNVNLHKTVIWHFDSRTTEILSLLNETGKSANRKMKIDYSWPFRSSIDYYVQHGHYPFVEVARPGVGMDDAVNPNADYYIFLTHSMENVGYLAERQEIDRLTKDTVYRFGEEDIVVFTGLRK